MAFDVSSSHITVISTSRPPTPWLRPHRRCFSWVTFHSSHGLTSFMDPGSVAHILEVRAGRGVCLVGYSARSAG